MRGVAENYKQQERWKGEPTKLSGLINAIRARLNEADDLVGKIAAERLQEGDDLLAVERRIGAKHNQLQQALSELKVTAYCLEDSKLRELQHLRQIRAEDSRSESEP